MRTSKRSFLSIGVGSLALACATLGTACTAEVMEEEPVAEATEGFSHSPGTVEGYRWQSSINTIQMTPSATSFCFLSGVFGAYQGSGDLLHIGDGGTFWHLGGGTGSSSHGGNARCIHGITTDGPTYTWENQAKVDMGTATGRTCFLVAVWGNLASAGEEVRTRIENGRWVLDGNSAGGQARCVRTPSWLPTDLSASSVGSKLFRDVSTGLVAHNPNSNTPWVCGLTRVSGLFRSGGSVQVRNIPNGGTFPEYDWYIGNTRNSSFLHQFAIPTGSGRCVN